MSRLIDASASGAIEEFAPAKINLFLHVGDKRGDGFHALESLVVFVDAGDRLTFEGADALSLRIDGPFGEGLAAETDNLVLRAARALAGHAGIQPGAAITLTKNLPVASGIGGGSADAAAALRGLARLWNVDIGSDATMKIAETLGSDVRSAWRAVPPGWKPRRDRDARRRRAGGGDGPGQSEGCGADGDRCSPR